MLGNPPRPPRLWPDPPPAHSNVEEHLVTCRSVSQLACHQVFREELKEPPCCKPVPLWPEKGLKDIGCSRTTPRCLLKPDPPPPTPCQVQEVTTSSKTDMQGSTNSGIPVGIAIGRQRVQQSAPSPLIQLCPERPSQPAPTWPSLAPTPWQFHGSDHGLQALPSMSLQQPSMGFQITRDPHSGQYLLLSAPTDAAQRAVVWPGTPVPPPPPPPLQVMHAAPPQPLYLDRLVTLSAPHPDKRRLHDPITGVLQAGAPSGAPQGLFINPGLTPQQQAFSTHLLVSQMPFHSSTNHPNSLLLSAHMTEQSLINQGSVVISNHLENTVINPQIIGMEGSGFSPHPVLQHMPPGVVISHTETNSFVRSSELTPVISTAVDNQIVIKSDKADSADPVTSPHSVKEETDEMEEEPEVEPAVVADAQNQTETPTGSEEEDSRGDKPQETALCLKHGSERKIGLEKKTVSTKIIQHTRTWTSRETEEKYTISQVEETHTQQVTSRREPNETKVDISGLELLSNSIEQHENYRSSSSEPEEKPLEIATSDSSDDEKINVEDDESTPYVGAGLNILCQVAEQHLSQQRAPSPQFRRRSPSPQLIPKPADAKPTKEVQIPLSEVCKTLKDKAKKLKPAESGVKDPQVATETKIEEERRLSIDPPVLEPAWTSAPQFSPPSLPPTLTPNKKRRSCDTTSEPTADEPLPPLLLLSCPPKKRRVGRPKKEDVKEPIHEPPVDTLQIAPKHKIRPKLKAEAKVKEPDEMEEDVELTPPKSMDRPLSPWRFPSVTPKKDKIKIQRKNRTPLPSPPIKDPEVSVPPKEIQPEIETRIPILELPKCQLTEEHLKAVPVHIMMFHGGHFYPALITEMKAEGIYEVIYTKNNRNRRPQILCTEELLNSAILEVKVDGFQLPTGTRVCSFWSQEYSYMYAGTVSSASDPRDKLVYVDFDDGDNGRITRGDIRLIPDEHHLIDYDPEPSSPLMSRRRRNNSTTSSGEKTSPRELVKTDKVEPLVEMDEPQALSEDEPMPDLTDASKCEEYGPGSDTPPALSIRTIVETERSEKEKKRLKKEEKRRRLLENGHKHKHDKDHRHHKRKHHKHHQKHRHKHSLGNSELRIKDSTVSRTGTEIRGKTGPLVTTIAKPADSIDEEKEKKERKPKTIAFLAPNISWSWKGDGIKRGRGIGSKGRARKVFYKAIQRGSDTITVGDCAVFISTGRPDRPFIGQIEAFWASQKNSMAVKVSWFYHPEETIGAPEVFPYPGALFKSPHTDINDVQTISHRCEVVPLEDFVSRVTRNEVHLDSVYDKQEVYYLAGFYDPHVTSITFEDGALINQSE